MAQLKGRKRHRTEIKSHSKSQDEEIDSDIEDFVESSEAKVEDEEADDFFESTDQKRVFIAKRLLDRMGFGVQEDAAVAEKLKIEAEISSKKLTIGSLEFFRGHKDTTTCVALSGNDTAFTGGKDCSIIKWDIKTGAKSVYPGRRNKFDSGGHFAQCLDVTTSDDGNLLVSVGRDKLVRIWDVRIGGGCINSLQGHSKSITAVCFEPESEMKQIFTTGEVWSLFTQTCQDTSFGHTASPSCIDILTKGRPITGGDDGTVRLWNQSTASHLLYHNHTAPVDAVLRLNAQLSVSGSQDGSILVWSVSSRDPVFKILNAHGGNWITALVIFQDAIHSQGCLPYGDVFFSGSDDGFIRCWHIISQKNNTKQKAEVIELKDKAIKMNGIINQIQISKNGKFLIAAIGREHRLGRWKNIKESQNGLLIVPLEGDFTFTTPSMK